MNQETCYILREREFIRLNENIYKIGKTKQPINKRLSQYPKGSELLLCLKVNNCDKFEKNIIKI